MKCFLSLMIWALVCGPLSCGDDNGTPAEPHPDTAGGVDTSITDSAPAPEDSAIDSVDQEQVDSLTVEDTIVETGLSIFVDELPAPAEGIVFGDDGFMYTGTSTGHILKISDQGQVETYVELLPVDSATPGTNGLTIGPDGALYACRYDAGRIERVARDGSLEISVYRDDIPFPNAILFATDGTFYFSSSGAMGTVDGYIGRIPAGSSAVEILADKFNHANGIALSPDNSELFFAASFPGSIHRIPFDSEGNPGEPELVSDDTRLSIADGLLLGPDGTLYIAGFGAGYILAWAKGELTVVAEDKEANNLQGVASLAWGRAPGFSPTAIYATNLALPLIMKVELGP